MALLTPPARSVARFPAVCLAAVYFAGALSVSGEQRQTAPANARAAALKDFDDRCNGYLKLREELAKKLDPLTPTASAPDLQSRQQALAAALKSARAGAKQGDMIPLPVQRYIRAAVKADFAKRRPAAKQASLVEVPHAPTPAINRTYPEQAALPTMPPLLLANLPPLPDNLQYRFYGRHVVLLDGDTQIIVDYITDVLPPH
jgi:hypothetical protein